MIDTMLHGNNATFDYFTGAPTMTSTAPGTWEPDWEELSETYLDGIGSEITERCKRIITNYREQQRRAGLCVVSAEDAQTTGRFAIDAFKATYTNGTTDVLDAVYDCCFRVYEAGRIARLAAAADGGKDE